MTVLFSLVGFTAGVLFALLLLQHPDKLPRDGLFYVSLRGVSLLADSVSGYSFDSACSGADHGADVYSDARREGHVLLRRADDFLV